LIGFFLTIFQPAVKVNLIGGGGFCLFRLAIF
jgi:hypothetical protein